MADIATTALAAMSRIVPGELNRIAEIGAIATIGLTVNVSARESDLILLFNLGNKPSRIEDVRRKVAAVLSKPVEFEDVIDITGHGTTKFENLRALGVIRKEKEKWVIDVHKMIDNVESPTVVVTVKAKFPEELLKQMIRVHINKAAGKNKGKLVYYMEVAINHAWKNVYGSVDLRDIAFTINIENITGMISENMPSDMSRHLKSAAAAVFSESMSEKAKFERALKGYAEGGAWALLIAAAGRISHLTSQEIPLEIGQLTKLDPSDEFEFLGARSIPYMAALDRIPFPMYFPSLVRIAIRTRLDPDTTTRKGTVEVDLDEIRKMIRQATKEIRSLASSIRPDEVRKLYDNLAQEVQASPEGKDYKDGDLVFD